MQRRDMGRARGRTVQGQGGAGTGVEAGARAEDQQGAHIPGRVCKRANCSLSGSPVEKPWTYSSGVVRPSGSRKTYSIVHTDWH